MLLFYSILIYSDVIVRGYNFVLDFITPDEETKLMSGLVGDLADPWETELTRRVKVCYNRRRGETVRSDRLCAESLACVEILLFRVDRCTLACIC